MSSLACFASVRKLQHSKEPAAQNLCAVLAAATEVIEDKHAEPTPVAYFGVLYSALQKFSTQTASSSGAILHLLDLVFPHLPVAVMRSQADSLLSLTQSVLSEHGAESLVAKHGLMCLSFVLRSVDAAAWSRPSVMHGFHSLVSECLDVRPKVRRSAVECVVQVLASLRGSSHKRASKVMADIVTHALQRADSDMKSVFHALGLCAQAFPNVYYKEASVLVNHIAKLLSLGNDLLSSTAYLALNAAVAPPATTTHADGEVTPPDAMATAAEQKTRPTPDSVGDALRLALSHVRAMTDVDAICRFCSFAQHAVALIAAADASVAGPLVGPLATLLLSYLAGEHRVQRPVEAACSVLVSLVSWLDTADAASGMARVLAGSLGVSHREAWQSVLKVVAAFFRNTPVLQLCGPSGPVGPLAAQCVQLVQALDRLHGAAPQGALEDAIGGAIAGLGPRFVLNTLPLNLLAEDAAAASAGRSSAVPRVWTLPLYRRHVVRGELALFRDVILPMAGRISEMLDQVMRAGRVADAAQLAEVYELLSGTFVGLCHQPVDIAAVLPELVPALLSALGDSRVRNNITLGLAALVHTCVPTETGGGSQDAPSRPTAISDVDRAALASVAQQLLPPLFSAFTSAAPNEREPIARAVSALAVAANASIVGKLFEQALKKLLQSALDEGETAERRALADLAVSVVQRLPPKAANMLYRAVKPQLMDPDAGLQKQAYKALRHLLTLPHFASTPTERSDLLTALADAAGECVSAARRGRLRAITALVERLEGGELRTACARLIGDAVFGTKEVAQRTREAAFDALVTMADRAQLVGGAAITPAAVVAMVTAGLAGATPYMLAAGALALSRLVYHLGSNLPLPSVRECVATMRLLLEHRGREVLKAAVGFVKVAVVSLPRDTLASIVPDMLQALLGLPPHHKRAFRVPIRVIVERLVRKLGEEAIVPYVPEDQEKLLSAIRKEARRHQREKAARETSEKKGHAGYEAAVGSGDDGEDSEGGSGSDYDSDELAEMAGAAAAPSDDEHATNLLNPRVAARMAGRRERKGARDDEFGTAADGRLMIGDGDADRERLAKKAAKAAGKRTVDRMATDSGDSEGGASADGDDDADDMSVLEFNEPMTHKLRKKLQRDDHDSEDEGPARRKQQAKMPAGKQARSGGATQAGAAQRSAVKVKGGKKLEPYAYVPLNPKALNKRRRAKAHDEFSGVVRSAKRGAQTGEKQRRRSHKK